MPAVVRSTIIRYTARSKRLETGGILIGHYSEDKTTAIVTIATPAPRDSRASFSSFERGVKDLESQLQNAWNNGRHYVGEWHYHTLPLPRPSETDLRSLAEIASNPKMYCSNPILLIAGSDGMFAATSHKAGALSLVEKA